MNKTNPKPDFEDILDAVASIPDKAVSGVMFKKGRGRPKSKKTLEAEASAARKEFVDNYETLNKTRPEPKRMILALSLPLHEQKQALEDAMQPRQLAFCKEYVIDFNRRQAGIRAGYKVTNVDIATYQLMQYRAIRRLIEIYTESNAQKVTQVDKDYVLQKVTEIVSQAEKDSDKLRGLELLARYLGMFIERTEITGKDGEAIRIEETKKQADEVAQRLRTMGAKTSLSLVSDKTALSVIK